MVFQCLLPLTEVEGAEFDSGIEDVKDSTVFRKRRCRPRRHLGGAELVLGGAEGVLGGAEVVLGGAEGVLGRAEVVLGGAEGVLGRAEVVLGGAAVELGGAEVVCGQLVTPEVVAVRFVATCVPRSVEDQPYVRCVTVPICSPACTLQRCTPRGTGLSPCKGTK
jgi:hypothetical protein